MILVFGGTTEGKKVASYLSSIAMPFVYSTKTKTEYEVPLACIYRYGALSVDSLTQFCISEKINLIIHASHPFAVELSQTIQTVADLLHIAVVRFERKYPERMNHKLVHYFKDYDKVLHFLDVHKIEPLLILTGVQTLNKLRAYWARHTCYARILPRKSSLDLALQQEFPEENLILKMPNETVEAEKELINKYGIKGVLTKESGEAGFLDVKILASINSEIPILILERTKSIFRTITEVSQLNHILSSVSHG